MKLLCVKKGFKKRLSNILRSNKGLAMKLNSTDTVVNKENFHGQNMQKMWTRK